MRKLGSLLLALLLWLVPAGLVARSQAAVPGGFSVSTRQELAGGVEFLTMGRPQPPAVAYVARIGPGAPASLRAVSANDKVTHHGEDLELPSSMCRRVGCVVGVNADFHYANHEPVGGVVSDGRMLRSPVSSHAQLSLTRAGGLVASPLEWSAILRTSDGGALGLGGINISRGSDQLVLYTPTWGDRTRTEGGGVELVLRAGEPVGLLGRPTAVELLELRGDSSSIPADGAVLSGSGSGAALLRDLWNRVERGRADRRAELTVASSLDVVESLGVNPVLLRNGRRAFPPATDGFTLSRHPRTMVGWNTAGEVFMVAIDGRREDSKGMSLGEAADLLLGLGATEGVNFDGGGGTTFVVNGSVANHPSDDDPVPAEAERWAVNSLVVVPKPGPPPPPPPPPPDPSPAPSPSPAPAPGTSAPAPSGGSGAPGKLADASTPTTTTAPSKPGLSPLLRNPDTLKAIASAVRPNGSRKARVERVPSTGSPASGAQEPSTTTTPPTEPPGHQDLALGDGPAASPSPPMSKVNVSVAVGVLLAVVAASGLGFAAWSRWRREDWYY